MARRRLVEGFWDCKYCGTKKIRGGLKTCPGCGKSQGTDTVFQLDRKNIRYVPEEEAQKISRNPDWVCPYCEQLNPDNLTHCKYCGSERTSENIDYFENQRQREERSKPKNEQSEEEQDSHSNQTRNYSYTPKKDKHSSFFDWIPGIASAIIAVLITAGLIFGLISLFMPKEKTVTVDEVSWSRSIGIERYQPVQESAWNLPSGARLLYSREEVYDTVQVIDHYEEVEEVVVKERLVGYEDPEPVYNDLGNGYFEEIIGDPIPIYEEYTETVIKEVPVYRTDPIFRTKYYYEVYKWKPERSVKTFSDDKNPYWGEVILASDERESGRSESYMITATDDKGKQQDIYLSFEDWNSLKVGQSVKLKVSLGHGEIVE